MTYGNQILYNNLTVERYFGVLLNKHESAGRKLYFCNAEFNYKKEILIITIIFIFHN